ncbi:MAG: hypothetical protein ACOY4F_08305 [Thermodesulfobacteriota bacterium]
MRPAYVALFLLSGLCIAILLGMFIRRRLPDHHLGKDTFDAIKLAIGLVATMTALLLGFLINSAKGSYDASRTNVLQMSAKIMFLDRVLAYYGPEADALRHQFRDSVEGMMHDLWPNGSGSNPHFDPDTKAGNAFFNALQALAPDSESGRNIKHEAVTLTIELGQLRTLIFSQLAPSISGSLLFIISFWLVIIFFNFSLLSPPNATAMTAMLTSAVSISGAIFLILELDRPFTGAFKISSESLLNALNHLIK